MKRAKENDKLRQKLVVFSFIRLSDGYFYITTDGEDVRVTISGAMYENGEEGQKTNFRQAILSFINKIPEFFGISL